jgi:cytochrome c-type protein NapC
LQWNSGKGKESEDKPELAATESETAPAETVAAAIEAAPAPAPEEPAATSEAAAPAAAPAGGANPAANIDWANIEPYEAILFYTGQASMEWTLKGSEHGGKRAFVTGDRCYDCHDGEEESIGDLIVSGDKAEATPIPGKRGSILVKIQAAHDAENLFMRFQWEDGEHVPIPFVDGGKMDPENPIKLAVMITEDLEEDSAKVEWAERSGCWQTCHHDLNYMPHRPDDAALQASPLAQRLNFSEGLTKYLKESRTALEIEGKEGKMRGGWDKLKDDAELQALLESGAFMDLLRYNGGTGESEDGHILAERVMNGGQGVNFTGSLQDGTWTVLMTRKMTSDKPGDISMSTDQWYNIGFAIHDDFSDSRFHHVSLGFKLGFDDEDAEINAIGK